MHASLETDRLILLPWTADAVGMLARLAADPRIVRYVGDGTPWTATRSLEVSDRQLGHWHQHGFGWRVIVETATGEEIGLVCLNFLGDGAAGVDPDEYEIGWWLDPRRWGLGFAFEAASAVARHAFDDLLTPSLLARIHPPNKASIGVATKLGMSYEQTTTGRFDDPCAIYRVTHVTHQS
jgi:RimJ/RimL family protein N-acetyltransferase